MRDRDHHDTPGRPAGTLRLRAADADAGHLTVGEGQLRRPHAHRPVFHHPIRRGQLGTRTISGSFDNIAGSLTGLFDFTRPPNTRPVLLDPTTGQVQAVSTTTTLQAVPSLAFQSIPVILIANVSPLGAAGTVQFKDGTNNLGDPVQVTFGPAILVTSALTAGTHTLTAEFTPTNPTAFAPSTSPPSTVTVRTLF